MRLKKGARFINPINADGIGGGNVRRAYALFFAVLCFVFISAVPLAAGETETHNAGRLSVSDILSEWGSALVDPSTYSALAQVDGFISFLMNETFLSSLSSNTFGSLSRSSILGTIPNIFFVVCILCTILSVAVAIMDLKKLDVLKRIVKK